MPVLLLDHSTALSIGGILRYRIRVDPVHGVPRVKALQFRVRNTSPVYRNLTPTSGPWKIAIALVRGPPPSVPEPGTGSSEGSGETAAAGMDRKVWCQGIVPELSPSVGCGQVCRFTAMVDKSDPSASATNNNNSNEWELEVMSEMVTQKNWLTVRVEVLAELENKDAEAALEKQQQQQQQQGKTGSSSQPPLVDNKDSKALDGEDKEAADIEDVPQVLLPDLISCEYKDTAAICGANLPRGWLERPAPSSSPALSSTPPAAAVETSGVHQMGKQDEEKHQQGQRDKDKNMDKEDDGLHLVVLTHGIHGSWLDLLYMKEQIDRYAEYQRGAKNRTVTFLSDTNHAGTEEGLQMAGRRVARDILEITGFWPRRSQRPAECMTTTTATSNPALSPSPSSDRKHSKNLGVRWKKDSSLKPKEPHATATTTLSTLAFQDPITTTASCDDGDNPSQKINHCRLLLPPSSMLNKTTTTAVESVPSPFPRGFRRISFVGHSLGGLINIYALSYIDSVTKGRFFRTLEPIHFTTLASPLLGVGLDHPWVLGFALSKGVIGQTGKDLSMEDRSAKVSSSASSSSSSSSAQVANGDEKGRGEEEDEGKDEEEDDDTDTFSSHEHGSEQPMDSEQDCELDQGPEPLLVAMARPGSVSHRALKRFKRRILYGNIENDLPVQYNTCTLMGISGFDRSHFFSADGPASGQRRNLYHVALQSYMSILFPKAPPKTKWMDPYGGPSPIVVVYHSEPLPSPRLPAAAAVSAAVVASPSDSQPCNGDDSTTSSLSSSSSSSSSSPSSPSLSSTLPRVQSMQSTTRSASLATQQSSSSGKSSMSSSLSPISTWSARAMSVRRRRKHGQESQQETVVSRTTEELAQLVADGYQTEMEWTKIGVYLQSDAHVQIIVRRRWYNVDGWPCVRDFVERHDFS